jgi:hypothetical protein
MVYENPVLASQKTLLLRYRDKPVKDMFRFEVFKAMTMKNAVFWDVTPRGSCRN